MRIRRIYDDPPSVRRRNLFNWNSTGQMALNPLTLFLNGEQGVWYDPSDFSTMFQDSAGTTPVTAVEQPVGLLLDKSKGLTLGPELVTNGDFSNGTTGWTGQYSATLSTVSSQLVITYGGQIYGGASSPISLVIGKTYKISFDLISNAGAALMFAFVSDIATGATNRSLALNSSDTPGKSTAYFTAITASSYIVIGAGGGGLDPGESITIANVTIKEVPGNHASQATTTKRPLLRQDGNGKYYLYFDGVDDALATSAINFTATDKMTVFAGLRKLSDAARGMVVELSATTASNNGSFALTAPNSVAGNYAFESKGTVLTDAIAVTYTSPITSVVTGIGSIAADSNIIRVNGAQIDSDAGDQGTGNFGNYPLYVGSRGGTSVPFNGHIYSLIVRGAQSTATQLVSAETYVNSKTGAY